MSYAFKIELFMLPKSFAGLYNERNSTIRLREAYCESIQFRARSLKCSGRLDLGKTSQLIVRKAASDGSSFVTGSELAVDGGINKVQGRMSLKAGAREVIRRSRAIPGFVFLGRCAGS
jgi:hypothetical protein